MQNEIMVSILCAAYNHEKYIRQCLDGFVMQKTTFKYEVLVHDDASTDKTADIIREYEERYPDLIKPIYQTENQYSKGVKVTNIIAEQAKGKYIALCEGDDFWTDENKLQLQVEALEAHSDCKMCVHKVKGQFEDTQQITYFPPYDICEGVIESREFLYKTRHWIFQTSSYFVDRELFLEHCHSKLRESAPVGDEYILLFFGSQGGVYYLNREMSFYRRGTQGGWTKIRKSWDEDKEIDFIIRMINLYKEFDKHTNGKYHDLMQIRIFERLWPIGGYKEMLKREYKGIRKGYPLKMRLYIFLKAYFPRLMKLLKK